MKIKIGHLYYDLLNLYGEQGNIVALKSAFNKQNIEVQIDRLSIGDKINFKNYDILYMGTGSDSDLLLVLDDIKKYTDDIKKTITNNKYFIATGNSHEIFGKSLEINNQNYEGLNIFNFESKQNSERIVGESLMKFKEINTIIGFQNRSSFMNNDTNHLFEVIKGNADNLESNYEGYYENNFIGTYLIGPLLIRNPHFTDYIIKDILTNKKQDYQEITNTYEYTAYNEYINHTEKK